MDRHTGLPRPLLSAGCALLAISNFCGGLGPARADTYIDALYSNVNVDFKPFPDEQGLSLLGFLDVSTRVTVFGHLNTTEFRPSGPELGRFGVAGDWTVIGAEYGLWQSAAAKLLIGGAYQSVKLGDDRESGASFHVGGQWRPHDRVLIRVSLGYLDLVVDDVTGIASAGISLTRRLAWTLRIEDHSDWDFTAYETGLRWYFGSV